MPSSFLSRRRFLSSTGMMLLIASAPGARAAEYAGALPWKPFAALPPDPPLGGRWYVFTPEEARTVEAVVDRLIPADELSIGGKEAGCASFIDRQLAGSYGSSDRLYMQGPFAAGLPTQGYQGSATPAGRYREGLSALNKHARATLGGKAFFELAPAEQDKVLQDFEAGKVELGGIAVHIMAARAEHHRVGAQSGLQPIAGKVGFGKADHDQRHAPALALDQRVGGQGGGHRDELDGGRIGAGLLQHRVDRA